MDEGGVWPALKSRSELVLLKSTIKKSIFRLRESTQVIGI
jgi:hypothetical protein